MKYLTLIRHDQQESRIIGQCSLVLDEDEVENINKMLEENVNLFNKGILELQVREKAIIRKRQILKKRIKQINNIEIYLRKGIYRCQHRLYGKVVIFNQFDNYEDALNFAKSNTEYMRK